MQLLFIANRYERKPEMDRWLEGGLGLLSTASMASSIAHGEAQNLDPEWLAETQKFLPRPHLTVWLDIAPETAVRRKAADRDRFERDLPLLARACEATAARRRRPTGSGSTGSGPRTLSQRTSLTVVASQLGLR